MFVQCHGGREPYLTWQDPTGNEPGRIPIVFLQPTVKLKETAHFARNAQWALIEYYAWTDNQEHFLQTDANGEPRDPEYVKQFFVTGCWINAPPVLGTFVNSTGRIITAQCER